MTALAGPVPVIRMHADPTLDMPWTEAQYRLLDQFPAAQDEHVARALRWLDQRNRCEQIHEEPDQCFECLQLVIQMGEVLGPVLRRLAEAERGAR